LITLLAGGTGSVKLARGLAKVSKDLTIVCNIGDNIWLYGLYVCPDIDTITYGLADMLDEKRGWGIKGDTFSFVDHMKKMGLPAWFGLGDRDLATHVYRTELLRRGKSLTSITSTIARQLGTNFTILPATDDDVQTFVSTPKGEMHLQEFWVRSAAKPRVMGLHFHGAQNAQVSAPVLNAIRKSERIIIAPANPVSSIGPMLAITGLRRALARARDKVVAVSPIIGGRPVSGPAAKYMKAVGLDVSPAGIAAYYKDAASSLVISRQDWKMVSAIEQLEMRAVQADIMMTGARGEARLARHLAGMSLN
jgi:LPPG:FO 2-phospho-L-lactate transferase